AHEGPHRRRCRRWAGGRAHGRVRRPGPAAGAGRRRVRSCAGGAGAQRVLRWQHRRHRLDHGARPGPHPGDRAGWRPLPAARRVPHQRGLSRRHRPRRPAPSRRGQPDRRPLPQTGTPLVNRSVVAVVGRPNVGKSTLVNRIIGRREAIVEEEPGVTRDRKILEADWNGREFLVVDTGGWMAVQDGIGAQVSRQAERAIAEADVVLLVVDATVGVTEEDDRVAGLLRRSRTGKPVLVAANKVDEGNREADAWAFARLGLGDPIVVSALHGRGTGDLLDAVVDRLPEAQPEADKPAEPVEPDVPAVAIVGRPNVGKSTLFNRLIGDDRSVVHDVPGTTRDSIDTVVETDEGPIRFVDTAGMRRKSRIDEGPEYYSLVRALQSIDR